MTIRTCLIASTAIVAALGLVACNSGQNGESASTPAASITAAAASAQTGMNEPLKANDANVELTLQGAPVLSTDGNLLQITVHIVNHGSATLMSNGAYPVNLGAHLLDSNGRVVDIDLARAPLSEPLPARGYEAVTIKIPADKLGDHSVAVLPVQEGIAWFDHWGMQPLTVGPFIACASDATKLCDKSGQPIAAMAPASPTAP